MLSKTQMLEQTKQYKEQMDYKLQSLMEDITHSETTGLVTILKPFDSDSELWSNYLTRFRAFFATNSILEDKRAHVFLTNQSTVTYKFRSNLAAQSAPFQG